MTGSFTNFLKNNHFKTVKVSRSIKHDHTNALFYLWTRDSNQMWVHFFNGEYNEPIVTLNHENSFFLNWHKGGLNIRKH